MSIRDDRINGGDVGNGCLFVMALALTAAASVAAVFAMAVLAA